MRYLVVSDIHGSSNAMNKINLLLENNRYDAILCCGDILYHGPRNGVSDDYDPKYLINQLNAIQLPFINVKGNCDGEVDSMVLKFPIDNTTNSMLVGNHRLLMSHGHHINPESDLSFLNKDDIFMYGHVHIPYAYQNNQGIYILNPGSTTFPKENHPKTYGELTANCFTIYRLDDDTQYMQITFNA